MLIIRTFVLDLKFSDLLDKTASKLGLEPNEVLRRAVALFIHARSVVENKGIKEKKGKKPK